MKKILTIFFCATLINTSNAQDNIYPAKKEQGKILIKNATLHTGTGSVLTNANILINDGKIEKIGTDVADNAAKIIDATNKHVYPGIILSSTTTGLREIASQVRGSNDFNEIGELNPNIRSIVAYNTDSKIINTLRSNGILIGNVVPRGSLIAGTSSVVQFDAWHWEDAVYKMNNSIQFYMPSLLIRQNRFNSGVGDTDPLRQAMERIENVRTFFREAKAYNLGERPAVSNLKFESVKGLFDKSQKLFIHCNIVKEMLIAIDFAKEFGFDVTIVGGSESYQMPALLKQNNISVVLQQLHSLPTSEDDDVDQPFKTPAILQNAGVLFSITDEDGNTTGRNLPFNAGTATAYGLDKEDALKAITLNAAKIIGIDKQTGSLEVGKDANIIISEGDILDMRTSIITTALIQGREIDLTDKHKQLNQRYQQKYSSK